MIATVSPSAESLKETRQFIQCINPATNEVLGQVPVDDAPAVNDAVLRARQAQTQWAESTFAQRRAVLTHILDYVLAHCDELCGEIVQDSGKTWENALLGEIFPVCNKIRWLLKNGEKILKPEKVPSGILLHKKARIEYQPLGVVACIIPWNYPLQNIISSLVDPLMAGNAVVLKASEAVAWSTQHFQKIIDQALEKEGFDKNTVQILNGYGDTGAALVRSGVDKILFIGSMGNGRRIIEGSAEHLTPVVMELGGKDPLIVCDDAHLDKAVHSALGGTFINLGQNCIASERVIVAEGIYEAFVDKVAAITRELRQGVPEIGCTDVGAIVSAQQLELIERLVQDAIDKGARVLAGGARIKHEQGQFYPPTILADLDESMEIVNAEVFGPVMLIFKVNDDSQAIELANSTSFGLQSSVITQNKQRGERIASQLRAGATCINDFGLCYMNPYLPFGGVKYSGFGRMNGRDGLRAYTNPKAVMLDRFSIEIPPKLFPVQPLDYEKAKSTAHLLFAPTVAAKLSHLLRIFWLGIKGVLPKFSSEDKHRAV